MNASEAVADLLARSGLTKAELSRRSGVSRALIDDYLKGRRQPSVAQLQKLGEPAGFHVDLAWVDPTPAWARPNPAMDAIPLTIEERAVVLEMVCDLVAVLPARERGALEFPPFRELVATP
jgi:transcriptional regulator with XRE-family HTH domain